MSMWNGPIELVLDELFLVLGASLNSLSHDESYLEQNQEDLDESYDENNMYNIFEHQLKLKKKTSIHISNNQIKVLKRNSSSSSKSRMRCTK